MKQVIEDFANIADGIAGGVIQSIPETGTQLKSGQDTPENRARPKELLSQIRQRKE